MVRLFRSVKGQAGLFLLCSLFLSLGILRLNDLSLYTPDSSRYVIFGNSLAHGKGFVDDSQPVPQRFSINPPLYPLLLAPIEFFFPMSLIAVKIWTLIFGLTALVLFYRWILLSFGRTTAILSTVMLALNPLMLIYSSEALSEAPFIMLLVALFLYLEKYFVSSDHRRKVIIIFLTVISLLPLLREVGVAAVVAAAIFFFFRKRIKFGIAALLGAGICLGLWYLRNAILIEATEGVVSSNPNLTLLEFIPTAETNFISEAITRIWVNIQQYFDMIGGIVLIPLNVMPQVDLSGQHLSYYQMIESTLNEVGFFVKLATILTIFIGMYHDFKQSGTALFRCLFFTSYVLIIFAFPVHDLRYIFPLLPLIIFYLISTIRLLVQKSNFLSRILRGRIIVTACFLMIVPNLASIHQILFANISYLHSSTDDPQQRFDLPSYYQTPWRLVEKWIAKNLPENISLACPLKEAALFSGGRKVLLIDRTFSVPSFDINLRDNKIDYLLTPVNWGDLTQIEIFMKESKRFWFEPLIQISHLYLFRVHSQFKELGKRIDLAIDSDSLSLSSQILKGRSLLLNERYEEAHEIFQRALLHYPYQPDLLYQLIITSAMMGDSGKAVKHYQQLFNLPQSLGYILPAREQLHTMQVLRLAKNISSPENRTVQTFGAALTYWKQGYYRRACRLVNDLFEADTPYFTGLLWSFHFNYSLGDTSRARKYLTKLDQLDSTNTVVRVFHNVVALNESLKVAKNSIEQSNIHLALGNQYKKIELYEEAIDAGERALRENSSNIEAMLFLAEVFRKTSIPLMAKEYYNEILIHVPDHSIARTKLDSLSQQSNQNE
ncbi:MAG TPA: hypothetical protein VFF29_05690 [Bacteroidota bacterium]|nr:hypothetical protein [Bacteroidota bacterium]